MIQSIFYSLNKMEGDLFSSAHLKRSRNDIDDNDREYSRQRRTSPDAIQVDIPSADNNYVEAQTDCHYLCKKVKDNYFCQKYHIILTNAKTKPTKTAI